MGFSFTKIDVKIRGTWAILNEIKGAPTKDEQNQIQYRLGYICGMLSVVPDNLAHIPETAELIRKYNDLDIFVQDYMKSF